MPMLDLNTGAELPDSASPLMKANPLRVSVDSKQPIPDTAALSGSNGVQMPGPMRSGYEAGFDAVGRDMSGSANSYQGYVAGVQLPGGASKDEIGWGFGEDQRNASRPENEHEPETNQDFGALSDSGNLHLGDMAENMQLFGTVGGNTDGVLASDITAVFDQIADHNAGGATHPGSASLPGPAMVGIPLAAGSGPIGTWDAFNTGDADNDGY